MSEAPEDRPKHIYLVEERRAPTKDGPWGPWRAKPPEHLVLPRSVVSSRLLTAEEMRPRCMRIDADGVESWRELRCIPYVEEKEVDVETLGNIARAIRDEYFEQGKPGSHTDSDEGCVVIDWVEIARKALEQLK